MSLDITTLKEGIKKSFLSNRFDKETDDAFKQRSSEVDALADKLAQAIDTFVRSGDVKVKGITTDVTVTVSTEGTALKQTGTGTGIGTQAGATVAKIE